MPAEVTLGGKLPVSVREKLSDPLRLALQDSIEFRKWHTLPVRDQTWQRYITVLKHRIAEFHDRARDTPENFDDFHEIREWIDDLLVARSDVITIILALQPFEHFEEEVARKILQATDHYVHQLAKNIPNSAPVPQPPSRELDVFPSAIKNKWSSITRTFGLANDVDCHDENGEFSASRVMSNYYLRNGQLLSHTFSHIASLGMPAVPDLLVLVTIIGWIQSAEDEVAAYCAMDALFNRLFTAPDSTVKHAVLHQIESKEQALRQGRSRVNRAVRSIPQSTEEESALFLSEIYKRLVEGPVRQYGWAYHCLLKQRWTDPPMLSNLRDILIADGGWIARAAKDIILTGIRNGEAHEGLTWDGLHGVYKVEEGSIDLSTVLGAAVQADSFARGCDAAVACYKALDISPSPAGPQPEDSGRLASWRRAEALFGTNGLSVSKADFNSKVAKITCERIEFTDINPCFQALTAGLPLMPGIDRIEVFSSDRNVAIIAVTSEALARTYPVWADSLHSFTSNPLSTFLPANLNARCSSEDLSTAVRSAAWIAVDDVLDAITSSFELGDLQDISLLVKRIELVKLATKQCLDGIPLEGHVRITAVHEAAQQLSQQLSKLKAPLAEDAVERLDVVRRIRHWWNVWGPVERLPGMESSLKNGQAEDHQPALREHIADLRWRTI